MSAVLKSAMQTVVFVLDHEEYGIDISQVQEIIMLPHITEMPNSSDSVMGVINLRGYIIPIVNLKNKLFQKTSTEQGAETRVIVVEINCCKVGLIVDTVSEVVKVHSDMVVPVEAIHSGIQVKYVSGVAKIDNRLMVLLDLDRMFNTEEFSEACSQ